MRLLAIAALMGFLAAPLAAGPVEDSIARQLRDQGFSGIKVERTFLGRVRITAQSRQLDREIIVNPATGEILRDYWEERESGARSGGLINPAPGQPSYGSDDDDRDDDSDDDRDADRDDDADVDNSGRGNASDRGNDEGDDSDEGGDDSGRGGGDGDDGDSDADD